MDHTPHWGQMRDFFVEKMKKNVRINSKRNVKNKSLTIEKGLKKKDIH